MPALRVLIVDPCERSALELQNVLVQANSDIETVICQTAIGVARYFLQSGCHLVLLTLNDQSSMHIAEMKFLRMRGISFALVAIVDEETETTRSLASAAGANIFLLRRELPEYAAVILESCSRWSGHPPFFNQEPPVSIPESKRTPVDSLSGEVSGEPVCNDPLTPFQPITSSHPWCRLLESACWELCHSSDLPPLPGGRESCSGLSARALREGTTVSGTCPGGMKITAEPQASTGRPSCRAGICSEPPRQLSELVTVSELYGIGLNQLQELSKALCPASNEVESARLLNGPPEMRPREALERLTTDFSLLVNTEKSSSEMVSMFLQQILRRSSLEGAGVLIHAGSEEEYSTFLSRTPDGTIETLHLTLCDKVHQQLLDFGAPVSVQVNKSTRGEAAVLEQDLRRDRSYAFPLQSGRFMAGTFVVSSLKPIDTAELQTLWSLSELLAMSVERSQLRKQLKTQHVAEIPEKHQSSTEQPVSQLLTSDLKTLHQHSLEIAKDLENSVAIATAEMQRLLETSNSAELTPNRVQTIQDVAASLQCLVRELQVPGYGLLTRIHSPCTVTDTLLLAEAWLHYNRPDNVCIVREIPENLWLIQSEKTLLQRCVLNIVRNACEAVATGGEVRISVRNEDGAIRSSLAQKTVVIDVSDSGRGLDAETHVRIFEPSFSTKSTAPGVGFGLTSVSSLLQRTGGRIEISSRPGRGCTVRLRLPAIEQESSQDQGGNAVPSQRNNRGIIWLVDDDDSVRNMLKVMLGRAGYRFQAFASASEVLGAAQQPDCHVDVLVCDATLKPVNGMELSIKLQAQFPALKTLMISGFGQEHLSDIEASNETIPLLQKPFTGDELIRKLSSLLANTEAVAIA